MNLDDFIKLLTFCLKEMNTMQSWRFIAILLTIIICVYIIWE